MKERHSGNRHFMVTGDITDQKTLMGLLSLVISIVGYAPYIASIIDGRCKPHAFSWVIWTMTATLIFIAQLTRDAGPGAWVTGLTALACLLISLLSFRYGEKEIVRSDEIIFGVGLAAVPLWVVAQDPLWSVLLLTGINMLGFYPTLRKSYDKPHEEHAFFYSTCVAKFLFGLLAIQQYSLVTTLAPVTSVLLNGAFLAVLLWRRQLIAETQSMKIANVSFAPALMAERIRMR